MTDDGIQRDDKVITSSTVNDNTESIYASFASLSDRAPAYGRSPMPNYYL